MVGNLDESNQFISGRVILIMKNESKAPGFLSSRVRLKANEAAR